MTETALVSASYASNEHLALGEINVWRPLCGATSISGPWAPVETSEDGVIDTPRRKPLCPACADVLHDLDLLASPGPD